MNIDVIRQSPFRPPHWRLDRVLQLVGHRPRALQPTRFDDHSIRIYRRILLELAAAGEDETRRDEVLQEYPEICHAHFLHYSRDVESRQILEASLLTTESFTEIANRFATGPRTIEYYEALFFSVRDRLSNSFWIRQVIRGTFDVGRESNDKNERLAQRGYVLRLFAYFGGSLILDSMVQGLTSTKMPEHRQDVNDWLANALGQLLQSSAAAAASTLEMNQKNMIQTIKLALRARAASARTGREPQSAQYEEILEKMLASINPSIAGRTSLERREAELKQLTSAVDCV